MAGSVGAKRIKVEAKNERPNGQCVLCAAPEAFLHSNSAAVRAALATIYQRSRVSAKPIILTLRWWSETAGCAMKWQKGNRDRRPCSPTAECSGRKNGRAHGYWQAEPAPTWPDEASRPVRAHLPSLRLRTICVLTVSTVCGRRNERKRTA